MAIQRWYETCRLKFLVYTYKQILTASSDFQCETGSEKSWGLPLTGGTK